MITKGCEFLLWSMYEEKKHIKLISGTLCVEVVNFKFLIEFDCVILSYKNPML